VALFPPGTPVTILINGRPLAGYVRAYAAEGRVFAPVEPVLAGLADRLWFEGDVLVVRRGARQIRIRLRPVSPDQLDAVYVAAGPVLRALGATVSFEAKSHRLMVRLPPRSAVETPTPFDPAQPSAAPAAVFTPAPIQTPRPVWSGSPLPRRTPLFLPPPRRER
jgi:hypothetical protein